MSTEVYEITCKGIHDAREVLEKVLGLQFVLHDSMHWGGDYYLAKTDRAEYRVVVNHDFENEPIEDGANTSAILLIACFQEDSPGISEVMSRADVPIRLVEKRNL
jgi:hypothetical protein